MGKRILFIEDEKSMMETMRLRLEAAGYEMIEAYDGHDGLEKARGERPDLILLDIMLPGLNGYTLCRMLKFDDEYKHIPIIMLSARAQEDDKKLGYEVGADAYITKPFNPAILLSKIRELLK